eukprot:182664-Chlamydomonas_euryale.AAC.1
MPSPMNPFPHPKPHTPPGPPQSACASCLGSLTRPAAHPPPPTLHTPPDPLPSAFPSRPRSPNAAGSPRPTPHFPHPTWPAAKRVPVSSGISDPAGSHCSCPLVTRAFETWSPDRLHATSSLNTRQFFSLAASSTVCVAHGDAREPGREAG